MSDFVLGARATFSRTVTVRVPSPDKPDTHEDQSLVVQYEALTDEEALALDAGHAALPEAERRRQPHYFLDRVVIGWSGPVDTDGRPVPFSAAALARALARPWTARAFYRGYSDGVSGDEARLGN